MKKERERKKERTLQSRMCSHERLPHFLLLFGLDHHIHSVMSTQEGEFGFSWSPRSYQGSKKEGPNMGSFLAQVKNFRKRRVFQIFVLQETLNLRTNEEFLFP